MYFNFFCQVLRTSSPKCKIQKYFSESNWNTKFTQDSLRVN